MDRWVYHTILTQKAMKPIRKLMAQYPEVYRWTFAADNDPTHGAIENKNDLHKHVQEASGRLKLMQWPSQSPNINSIEQLWNWVKDEIAKKGRRPENPNMLWEWVKEVWQRVPMSLIATLVEGVPRRVAALKRSRGGATKY